MNRQEDDVFLSLEEAASHLGVSKRTVDRMAREGRVTWYRLGTRKRFKRRDLDESMTRVQGSAGIWEWQRPEGDPDLVADKKLAKAWMKEEESNAAGNL